MDLVINLNQSSQVAAELEREKKKIANCYSNVQNMLRNCPLSGSSRLTVQNALNKVLGAMSSEMQALENMKNCLTVANSMYVRCERNLTRVDGADSLDWNTNSTTFRVSRRNQNYYILLNAMQSVNQTIIGSLRPTSYNFYKQILGDMALLPIGIATGTARTIPMGSVLSAAIGLGVYAENTGRGNAVTRLLTRTEEAGVGAAASWALRSGSTSAHIGKLSASAKGDIAYAGVGVNAKAVWDPSHGNIYAGADSKAEMHLASGEASVSTGWMTATAKGDVGYVGVSANAEAVCDLVNGTIRTGANSSAEAHLAHGEVTISDGFITNSASGSVGKVSATGEVGATLMKNGRFSPQLEAKAKASASVLEGQVSSGVQLNPAMSSTTKAEGKLLTASAGAEAYIGQDAVGAKASAEAYLAKGTVSHEVNIFGVKVGASVTGKAGGAGVSAGAVVSNTSVEGEIGAGLGLGVGVNVSVDWSDFSVKGVVEQIDATIVDANEKIKKAGQVIQNVGQTVENAGEALEDIYNKYKFW